MERCGGLGGQWRMRCMGGTYPRLLASARYGPATLSPAQSIILHLHDIVKSKGGWKWWMQRKSAMNTAAVYYGAARCQPGNEYRSG